MILINILIIVGLSVIAAGLAYILISRRKKFGYDDAKKRAIMDEIRSSLEKQIYSLNDRLIRTEERWRDVNHLLLRNEYLNDNIPITKSPKTYFSEFLRANGITENDL